jgi:hypothetical protein
MKIDYETNIAETLAFVNRVRINQENGLLRAGNLTTTSHAAAKFRVETLTLVAVKSGWNLGAKFEEVD